MRAMPLHTARRVSLLITLAWAVGLPLGVRAQTVPAAPVRIATNVERSYFPPAEALLKRAYASLNLEVEFLPLPLPRAQIELRASWSPSGAVDGHVQAWAELVCMLAGLPPGSEQIAVFGARRGERD